MAKIVVDTTVLSNFFAIGEEDILRDVIGKDMCVTEEVIEELKVCITRNVFPSSDLSWIKILKMGSEERSLFLEFNARFGIGEASCLSVAIFRGLRILTDDLDARKFAQRSGIPVSGTIGVLVLAVLNKRISRDEGNGLLLSMINKGFYSPVNSLDEITGSV